MRLRISHAARRDLTSIWNYIAEDNPSRADTFLDEFYELFQTLAQNPEAGRRRDELCFGIRSFPKGNYVVFYAVAENRKELEVVRVLSGYRDLDKLF